VRRLIVISAAPLAPDADKTVFERRVLHPLLHRFFGGGYADMGRMEQLLAESDRDWTIFRPPRLTDKPAAGHYRSAIAAHLPQARPRRRDAHRRRRAEPRRAHREHRHLNHGQLWLVTPRSALATRRATSARTRATSSPSSRRPGRRSCRWTTIRPGSDRPR